MEQRIYDFLDAKGVNTASIDDAYASKLPVRRFKLESVEEGKPLGFRLNRPPVGLRLF